MRKRTRSTHLWRESACATRLRDRLHGGCRVRRIVVISDTQIPYHNEKQVRSLVRWIHATQPSEVVHIGDLMDYPQPARWSKDTRAEFEGSILKDSDAGK